VPCGSGEKLSEREREREREREGERERERKKKNPLLNMKPKLGFSSN
jgi:hypothetical protein